MLSFIKKIALSKPYHIALLYCIFSSYMQAQQLGLVVSPVADLIGRRSRDFYIADRAYDLQFEPSGHDFLSPGLSEADLMRRVLSPTEFVDWCDLFLPDFASASRHVLKPVDVADSEDGKLSHLDGLNLSRAWMLKAIAHSLPHDNSRNDTLTLLWQIHQTHGLASVTGESYAGAHWLATFAVYLLTNRGLDSTPSTINRTP